MGHGHAAYGTLSGVAGKRPEGGLRDLPALPPAGAGGDRPAAGQLPVAAAHRLAAVRHTGLRPGPDRWGESGPVAGQAGAGLLSGPVQRPGLLAGPAAAHGLLRVAEGPAHRPGRPDRGGSGQRHPDPAAAPRPPACPGPVHLRDRRDRAPHPGEDSGRDGAGLYPLCPGHGGAAHPPPPRGAQRGPARHHTPVRLYRGDRWGLGAGGTGFLLPRLGPGSGIRRAGRGHAPPAGDRGGHRRPGLQRESDR